MKIKSILISFILLFIFLECTHLNSKNTPPENQETAKTNSSQSDNPYYSRTDTNKLKVPLSEWKKILSPQIYQIAFKKGTDKRFTGYWNYKGKGTYYCAVCGNKLFRSTAKFASTCGWPSFFEPSRNNAVIYKADHRHGMNRTEVLCARCDAHLGHVFNDGPPPTHKRFCMDSSVLDFVPDNSALGRAK